MTVPTLRLLHGADIPQLGLGTAGLDDSEAERVVADAISAGYRLIDTAEAYGNEEGVGAGIRAAGVPREELFVTTKFNKRWHGRDLAAQAYEQSTARLGLDYLDLLLVHWPNPGQDRYVQAWDGLVQLLEAGRVRAIGTSNFKPKHLDRIVTETSVVPDVNQIELNPAVARADVRVFHAALGIVTESWSPLGGRGAGVLQDPVIRRIAAEAGRTPAQVVLRWHLELGLVPIPRSADPGRLRENLDVAGFRLTEEQVAAISALDRGEDAATDSDSFGH
jgi:2,5-diketo-D-gluconate reductase A